jgi:hypothetical protein
MSRPHICHTVMTGYTYALAVEETKKEVMEKQKTTSVSTIRESCSTCRLSLKSYMLPCVMVYRVASKFCNMVFDAHF